MRILVLINVFLFALTSVAAQSKATLEKQRQELLQQIEATSKILNQTKLSKKTTLSDLETLENQITNRNKFISDIQSEILQTDETVSQLNNSIAYLDSSIVYLKNQYSELLKVSYRNNLLENKWLKLLNASSINDAFVRWRYIQQFENYTKAKLHDLSIKQKELGNQKEELDQIKSQKKKLVEIEEAQSKDLINEKSIKNELLQKIELTESQLKSSLNKQNKQKKQLNNEIEKIIQIEIARVAENKTPAHQEYTTELASSFEKNKTRFNWPLKNAKIISKFGKQAHPKLKSVTISNNGIDLISNTDSEVKAIFDGVVVGVASIPGFDYMVLVQHGAFYSVYSKVKNVVVTKGDQVKTHQMLGTASQNSENKYSLHFELWQNKQKLNPELWLIK